MRRHKSPNLGLWSCLGGKLEMSQGESPYEAIRRETLEEASLSLQDNDLHLFAVFTEKAYEGRTHWLMFCFHCHRRLLALPPPIEEGEWAFHDPDQIFTLPIPETDRQVLWPLWFSRRHALSFLRADCTPGKPLETICEEEWSAPQGAALRHP